MDDHEFMSDQDSLHAKLDALQQEHRDLDEVITRLDEAPAPDQLLIQRMKKRKLVLKDQMAMVESQLIPDIIA